MGNDTVIQEQSQEQKQTESQAFDLNKITKEQKKEIFRKALGNNDSLPKQEESKPEEKSVSVTTAVSPVEKPAETPILPESLLQKYQRLQDRSFSTIGKQGNEIGQLRKELQESKQLVNELSMRINNYEQGRGAFQPHFNDLNKEEQGSALNVDESIDLSNPKELLRYINPVIKKEAERIASEKINFIKEKEDGVKKIVNEMSHFQNRHPEFKTNDSIENINKTGENHPEWAKFKDLNDLYSYGMEKGIYGNLEASFLLLQNETGSLEQRIKEAEKKGATETLSAIQKASNSTKTLGSMPGGEKTSPKSILEAKTGSEVKSFIQKASKDDLKKMKKEIAEKIPGMIR